MRQTKLLPVSAFTLTYLVVASFFALNRGNKEFVFYIVVVLLLGIITLLVHKRVQFSSGVLWLLSIWGFLHMLGGLVAVPDTWLIDGDKRVLYSLWLIPNLLKFDQVIHALGFAAATWACWQGLRSSVNVKPTFGILVLCALAGMGLGAINEIIEFIAVLLIANTNVGGYDNTGWDLVSNGVGAIIAAVIIKHGSR